jgi:altronate hydrolase
MYGVLVGKATITIPKGGLLTTANVHHASEGFHLGERKLTGTSPILQSLPAKHLTDITVPMDRWVQANYWIVVPLVFCENRNIQVLKEALVDKLAIKKLKVMKAM